MEGNNSEAAVFNKIILNKLQRALQKDPEIDLLSIIPKSYTDRLARRKLHNDEEENPAPKKSRPNARVKDVSIWSDVRAADKPRVLYPLSGNVKALLEATGVEDYLSPGVDSVDSPLRKSLTTLTEASKMLWQDSPSQSKAVFKCNDLIAVKVVKLLEDHTEYTSLIYLERHCPDIPVPRPHGLITVGNLTLIFMTYIPSSTLTVVWDALTTVNKEGIRRELEIIFEKLRRLKKPKDLPLGGTQMEGCQDARMQVRRPMTHVTDCGGFQDFQYSHPTSGGAAYIQLLKEMLPPADPISVFTHSDLRKDNVMVDLDREGSYHITGLIDWQYSGFYPSYHESNKVTNTMGGDEKSDWYLYLPDCIAPKTFAINWLVDRLLDRHVA